MNNKKASSGITRRDILKISAGAMVTQMVGFAGLASANSFVTTDLISDNSEETAKHAIETNKSFPFLIIRLHPRHHRNKETLAEVIELLRNKPGVCNEVWFCTEFGFPDLQKHRESAVLISEAAIKKTPDCRIGLQQCSLDWSSYYGPDMKQIFSAMEKATRRKPGSRLGHGYYNDHAPRGVLIKSFGIARQVERAIGSAEQICPEVENTNHTTMGKSPRGTAIESTLHLTMGCNSLSFALWNDMHLEGPESMELFLNKFEIWLPLWKLMAKYNENSSLGGLDLTFGRHHAGRPISKKEKPWDSWNVHSGDVMQITTLGLPLCPDSPLACASLLTAEAAAGLTNEELTQLFKGGVLLDGKAIIYLQERKPGFDPGVRATFMPDTGAIEILTNDVLNGTYKGVNWYQFDNSFYKLSFSRSHRVLGEMKTVTDGIIGCSTAVFENELGGRVGVLGFNGFQNILSSAKRMQLLNMADWISNDKLPAILETSE